jgi:hypothetical protein
VAKSQKRDLVPADISADASLTSQVQPSTEAVAAQRAWLRRSIEFDRVSLPADGRAVLQALLATKPIQD